MKAKTLRKVGKMPKNTLVFGAVGIVNICLVIYQKIKYILKEIKEILSLILKSLVKKLYKRFIEEEWWELNTNGSIKNKTRNNGRK